MKRLTIITDIAINAIDKCRYLFFVILTLCSISSIHAEDSSTSALKKYVFATDPSYSWKIIDSIQAEGVKCYRVKLVSQTWHGKSWIHELDVVIPEKLKYTQSLFHITGGSNNEVTGEPNWRGWDDKTLKALEHISKNCHAVTAMLSQVPNQPLFGGKKEDEIISYTYHQFLADHDNTWPLLLPMVKSAEKAMDAVQQIISLKTKNHEVKQFVLNGFSKRGWTTWLCAATGDKRIASIAPAVIDMLNMPVSIPYQKFMYGSYSEQIKDYVNLGLTEAMSNSSSRDLINIVDPYSYRNKLTLPKLILLGTNDEYWTVDAVKNYIDSIPGRNFICYTPNAGHSLGNKIDAVLALEAFFYQTIKGNNYPKFDYKIQQNDGKMDVMINTDAKNLKEVELWQATSYNKDFRQSKFTLLKINVASKKNFIVDINYPKSGYKAFMVMIKLRHPVEKKTYQLCTRMYFADSKKLYDK
jgi:PhoPQ-activated pathogenicity-related protein